MSKIMKGTLKCIRLHPVLQEMFSIQPERYTFGRADIEFYHDSPWDESTADFKDKIYITKINDKEIPKQLAWVDRIHTTCNMMFELNGNMFVIENITE